MAANYESHRTVARSMRTVGFIGLGSMGAPMAWNVSDAGFDLRVYNRTDERTKPFREEGIDVSPSPAAVAERANVVVTMVTNDDALCDVLGGDDGVADGLSSETTVINTSTVSSEATESAAETVHEAGGRFVDSPVSGTIGPAEQGTLTILAAGEAEVVEDVRPVLEAMGDPVVDCGGVGQGTAMKHAINLLLGGMMQGFAEMLVLGKKRGLDVETMLSVVESGGMDAPLFDAKGEKIRSGSFDPDFPVDLLFKDLNLALSEGGDVGVPLPSTAATREAASATRALGHGEEDMAALIRYLETVGGVEVRDE